MKTFYFLISIALLLIANTICHAVDFQKGILVLENGDSIHCDVRVYKKDVLTDHRKIVYKIGEEKRKIDGMRVSKVLFEDVVYERLWMFSEVSDTSETEECFMEICMQQDMNVYAYHRLVARITVVMFVPVPSGYDWITEYYAEDEYGFEFISKKFFKENYDLMFASHPDIIAKIKAKKLKYNDLGNIVRDIREKERNLY